MDVLAFLAERPAWSLLAALSAARRFWVELPLAGVIGGCGCDGSWVVSFLAVEMPPNIGANTVLFFGLLVGIAAAVGFDFEELTSEQLLSRCRLMLLSGTSREHMGLI